MGTDEFHVEILYKTAQFDRKKHRKKSPFQRKPRYGWHTLTVSFILEYYYWSTINDFSCQASES
jgi:hypothetical protein